MIRTVNWLKAGPTPSTLETTATLLSGLPSVLPMVKG
jgi:hypothetical protein